MERAESKPFPAVEPSAEGWKPAPVLLVHERISNSVVSR